MPFGPAASVGAEAATPLSPTGSPSLEANVSTTSDASETPLLAASISSGTPVAATKPSATPVAASTRKAQQTYDDLKAQGNTCVKQQQYAAAIEHYTRCIELEPTVMAAFNNRALCFLRLNKPVRAAADVTVVLAREPSNVKALFRLGQACAASGRVADAREALRKVLVLEPKNTAARRAYEQLPAEAGGCSATVVEQASPSSNADQGESASGGKATGKRTIVIEEVEDDSDDSDDNDEPDRDDEATVSLLIVLGVLVWLLSDQPP
jgi:tetratricopeptide (TPR) repeat protein